MDLEIPEREIYTKIILPKEKNEKIKALERYLKQVIIVNLNPNIKYNYLRVCFIKAIKQKIFH